ncbi:MAG TPA: hypothetical protein VFF24_09740 [Acidimicrobiia bacterium]|nr:hypothetical protein [Acidimicrobiia bacterium]
MRAEIEVAAGDLTVANEWATGDLVPAAEGYALPVTPLVLRSADGARFVIRGSHAQHREVIRRMAAVVPGIRVVDEPEEEPGG